MRISISVKWTMSAVVIVIMVVMGYAYFMISDTQKGVDRETERIRRIQYAALDQLGAQTTRALALPASSLMFFNDLEALNGLLAPIVTNKENKNNSYSAIYATIVAPTTAKEKARVWVAVMSPDYDQLFMSDIAFYDRKRADSTFVEEIDMSFLKNDESIRSVVTSDGKRTDIPVKQYAVTIKPKSGEDSEESSTAIQGYLVVGYSIEGLAREIESIREQGAVSKDEAIERSTSLALAAILLGALISGIQSIFVTRNIKILTKAANRIAGGDLSVRSNVSSGDEIGRLSEQFNLMANHIQALLDEQVNNAILQKELEIARSIQMTLLPTDQFTEQGPVAINGFFQPTTECGGDFWNYATLADGSILLTIGDVTGHGVPAAMITAIAKSALDTVLLMNQDSTVPIPALMERLNVAVCQAAKQTSFMTFLAICVSPDGRRAEIVNAGHNFPLLVRQEEVRALVARGERLGDNPNSRYQSMTVDLAQDDVLFLFTDGITEYNNAVGQVFGEKRLRKTISVASQVDVIEAMNVLWDDFSEFYTGTPQDDITMVFAKVL
jgi:serine phosphatase RsbU (regulator of sigma subunit)